MTDASAARPILLLGATDYAEVFLDSFDEVPGVRFAGCLQNQDPRDDSRRIAGHPVMWSGAADHLRGTHDLICILATTARSDWIDEMAARGFGFATLVHPSCTLSRRSRLGPGTSVDAGTVIAGFSELGDHVRIGRGVAIGHHTRIGRCSTVHPGAVICGHCRIGEKVMIGAGAVVIDHVEIGDGAVIAAGALVTKTVPARALYAGNPGRVLRPDYGPR